jgi:hypothetical protein
MGILALIALAQGFLFGSLEINRVAQLPETPSGSSS